MKKLISILLLFFSCNLYATDQIYPIDTDNTGFGGGVDYVSADKIASKYSPIEGILNVNTDQYNEIIKRLGTLPYNTTPTVGGRWHRRAYTYNQADGESYVITQTSNSLVASVGDGSFTTIISTLSDTDDCDFTTANDKLYFTNGVHAPGSWNGSILTNYTVLNSTNYPTRCKFITNFRNRNWMAGDSLYSQRVYFSIPFVPTGDTGAYQNYPVANFIDLGVADGDEITGIQVVNAGKLYVYFRYKIFEIIEINTGVFGYKLLSPTKGCLYNTTLDILDGFPTFLTHDGLEQFDGSNFKNLSLPIDYYIKNLRQMTVSQSILTLDSATDWGEGSGVNIDTTTYLGSVAMAEQAKFDTKSYNDGSSGATDNNPWFLDIRRYAEKIVSTGTGGTLYAADFYMHRSANKTGNFMVGVLDSNHSIISSNQYACDTIPLTTTPVLFNSTFTPVNLVKGSTYYLFISSGDGFSMSSSFFQFGFKLYGRLPGDSAPYGLCEIDSYTGVWSRLSGYPTYADIVCKIYVRDTSAYTSRISTASSSWGSWVNFTVSDIQYSSATLSYYVKTSTANDNFSTRPLIAVTNGGAIGSTVGPYILAFSSGVRLDSGYTPITYNIGISYYSNDNNIPSGKTWNGRYYLAINTNTATVNNDTVAVCQKNKEWTLYSQDVGCFVVYRDKLYYGDSNNTGYLYRMEVPNLYTDSGNSYPCKWTSKKININPVYKLNYKNIWITTKGISNTLTISYNFDDYNSDWLSKNITITDTRDTFINKVNILPNCYSRYFQFSVSNNSTANFRIKRLDLIYDDVPEIE